MTAPDQTNQDKDEYKHDTERRRSARLPPSAIPFLKSVKLVAGPGVKLINISQGGALIESEARLSPGSTICLRLVTGESVYFLKGRVLRARAASLCGTVLHYHIAIAFDEEFSVVDKDDASVAELPTPQPEASEIVQDNEEDKEPAVDISENPEIMTITAKYLENDRNLKRIFRVNDW